MEQFLDILSTYTYVNNTIAVAEQAAIDQPGKDIWSNRTVINDHAYFLLLFARLEQIIDDAYQAKVGNPADRYFLNKADDVIDDDEVMQMVDAYYEMRCAIAHGRSPRREVVVSVFIRDLNRIISDLR